MTFARSGSTCPVPIPPTVSRSPGLPTANPPTWDSALICGKVIVVDSNSTDGTPEITTRTDAQQRYPEFVMSDESIHCGELRSLPRRGNDFD